MQDSLSGAAVANGGKVEQVPASSADSGDMLIKAALDKLKSSSSDPGKPYEETVVSNANGDVLEEAGKTAPPEDEASDRSKEGNPSDRKIKEKEKDRSKSREKGKERDRDRDRDREKMRDRDRSKVRDNEYEREREHAKDRDHRKDRSKGSVISQSVFL